MKKILSVLVCMLLLSTGNAFAAQRPLKIAIEGTYAPFNYVDNQGTPKGFEVDLAKALCKSLDRKCDFLVLDWDGMIPGLLAHKVDIIAASMSITPERAKAVAFSHKYYSETGSFVGAKDSGLQITKQGLKGKRIGVQRATTWNNYVQAVYPDADIVYYDEIDRACLDLLSHRIDLVLSQSFYMSQWLKKPEAKGYAKLGKPVNDTKYIGDGIGFAMRKSDKKLLAQWNAALDKQLKDGSYQKIADKYFDFDIYGASK